MKKFEQIILTFDLNIYHNSPSIENAQKELSDKGAEGFRLINSFPFPDGNGTVLMCIMEREVQ